MSVGNKTGAIREPRCGNLPIDFLAIKLLRLGHGPNFPGFDEHDVHALSIAIRQVLAIR
jgi:hypothetical protein